MLWIRALLFLLSTHSLLIDANPIDVVWINPSNKFDSRFDSSNGHLKASTQNIPSLEIRDCPLPDTRRSLFDKKGNLLARDKKEKDVEIGTLPTFVEILGESFANEFSFRAKTHFYRRSYPYAQALAHAVGYASPEKAYSGLEVLLDQKISATKDSLNIVRDFTTSIPKIIYRKSKPDTESSPITLGLDAELQLTLYKKFKSKINEGVLLVSSSLTGEIPVMLSFPSFNPNASNILFENGPSEAFANRIYRNYEGNEWDSLRSNLRFEEDYESLQAEASRNYAHIMGVKEFVPTLKSVTPLYLLTLLQHLTYSPDLQLLASKSKGPLEHENLSVWSYGDRYFSANRVAFFKRDGNDESEIKSAQVFMGSMLDRKYNVVIIFDQPDSAFEDLVRIKELLESILAQQAK